MTIQMAQQYCITSIVYNIIVGISYWLYPIHIVGRLLAALLCACCWPLMRRAESRVRVVISNKHRGALLVAQAAGRGAEYPGQIQI